MTLEGKRALITGASGSLGTAIAERLARDGATVLLHANSRPESVEALAARIVAAGGRAECVVFDLRSDEASAAACARMLEAGPVQIIVNNAGVHDDAVLPGMRAEQWHKVIDISLNGFFRVTQPLLLPMLRTRWGRILNISSVASLTGNKGQVNYAAAKGALNSATKSLSLEVAARGVTVNAIAPGIIASPMADAVFDPAIIKQMVPVQTRRHAGRGRRAGWFPGERGRGLHHRAGDLHQRRNDLAAATAIVLIAGGASWAGAAATFGLNPQRLRRAGTRAPNWSRRRRRNC